MFGRHKQVAENASRRPPLVFHGVDLPEPTPEDLKWEKVFLKLLKKDEISELRDMLHEALIKENMAQIAMGLRLQYEHPHEDLLKAGDPLSLYSTVWNTDRPAILEMYINTYSPTEFCHSEGVKQETLNNLSYKTRKDWYEKGCGEYITPLMLSFIETNHWQDALKLLRDRKFDVNYKSGAPVIKMIKTGNWGMFQTMLQKDPDLTVRSRDIVATALRQEESAFLNTLVVEKNIVSHMAYTEINDLINTTKKEDYLNILKEARNARIKEYGINKPCRVTKNWTVLSETFVEFSRPKSPDGSRTKYQFDFDAGYMSYHYQSDDNNKTIPFETKPLAEVYAQNPQLIDKAIKALTDIGCPAPDLSSIFNESRQASRTIKAVPAAPKQPGLHK